MEDDRAIRIGKYLEKVIAFVACLKSVGWVRVPDKKAIEGVMSSAIDIQRTLEKDKTGKLVMALNCAYPEYDFSKCANLALETILTNPYSNEDAVKHAVEIYSREFGEVEAKDILLDCSYVMMGNVKAFILIKSLETKKAKGQQVENIKSMRIKKMLKSIKARTAAISWESMIAECDENFKCTVKSTVEKEPSSLCDILNVISPSSKKIVIEVILKLLKSDLKLWFKLLNSKNLETVHFLCENCSEFLSSLLHFLSLYTSQVEYDDDTNTWTHSQYAVNEFINTVQFLKTCDEKISIPVFQFIDDCITAFDEKYSFWIDMKASVL